MNTQHKPTYFERHLGVAELSGDSSIEGRPLFATLRIKLPLFENLDSRGQRRRQPEYKFERTESEIQREFNGYDFHDTSFRGHCKNEKGEWENDINVWIESQSSDSRLEIKSQQVDAADLFF